MRVNNKSRTYLDGLRGLIPCKVLSGVAYEGGQTRVRVKVTADRPGYRRGEVIEDNPWRIVVVTRGGRCPRVMMAPEAFEAFRSAGIKCHAPVWGQS